MRILRLKDVIEKTGLARSTIYKYIDIGAFPTPIPLGGRSVGWVDSEVHEWILSVIEKRDQRAGASGHPNKPGTTLR